jgi:hypothetical protein
MLLKKRSSFFTPTYPPYISQVYRYSQSPLHRNGLIILKNPCKPHQKRTYATQRPDFTSGSTNSTGGGIPLGQIPLGASKAAPQKGIAIKDDISKSWKELSIPQKIVRTGTQTTNVAIVLVGIGVFVFTFFG